VMSYSHRPIHADWQLLADPISQEVFVAQPNVETSAFFGMGLAFTSSGCVPGVVLLKGTNQGSVQLKVPQNVELMACLDGAQNGCLQKRDGDTVTVYFRTAKGPKEHDLAIFASQGSSCRSFNWVCHFCVVGSVGPAGKFPPCFPKMWPGAFAGNGLQFTEDFPNGLLKPDKDGFVSVRFKVPQNNEISANLEGPGGKKESIPCSRLSLDQEIVEIKSKVDKQDHTLTVFAARRRSVSYEAVASYTIEA